MNKVGTQELTPEVNAILDMARNPKDYTETLNTIKEDLDIGLDELSADINSIDNTVKLIQQDAAEIIEIDQKLDQVLASTTMKTITIELNETASGSETGLTIDQLLRLHAFSFVGTVGAEAYNGVGFYEPEPSFAFVQKNIAGAGGIYIQPYSNMIVTSSGEPLTGTITFCYYV